MFMILGEVECAESYISICGNMKEIHVNKFFKEVCDPAGTFMCHTWVFLSIPRRTARVLRTYWTEKAVRTSSGLGELSRL